MYTKTKDNGVLIYTAPTTGTYTINIPRGTSIRSANDTLLDVINNLNELLEKNIECGLLLDWDIKVKDTRLARKMYPDHVIRKGWLYAQES